MSTKNSARGSALILAVIAVLVVTTIGVAMLRMTYREVAGATAGARQQALVACAEAARVQLFSQMHALGFRAESLQPLGGVALGAVEGTAGVNPTVWAVGGHYDTPGGASATPGKPAPVVIEQVSPLPPQAVGPPKNVLDISNVLRGLPAPGQPFKVVALCKDSGGRELEVEFGVRFGM